VEVRTEVVEVSTVGEHAVDRDEHGVGDRHGGPLRAAAGGQALVASREEVGMGTAGSDGSQGSFDQRGPEVGVPASGRGVATLAGTLVVAGDGDQLKLTSSSTSHRRISTQGVAVRYELHGHSRLTR